MRIKPQVASVVGINSPDSWSQVLMLPTGYAVVEVEDTDGVARSHGLRILSQLTKYLETPPVSLEALSQIVRDLDDEYTKSIIIMVPVGKTIYISMAGQGKVYLKRDSSLAVILDDAGTVSGMVEAGDIIMLSTVGFSRVLDKEDIAGSFNHLDAQGLSEKLTLSLHQKNDKQCGSALIFQVLEITDSLITPEDEPDTTVKVEPVPPPPKTFSSERLRRIARRIKNRQLPSGKSLLNYLKSRFTLKSGAVIVIILVIILISSVISGFRRNQSSKFDRETQETITAARHAFEEGQSLTDLNPIKGRERLKQAQELLKPLQSRLPQKSETGQEVNQLVRDVNSALTVAMQISEVKPVLFFDMDLVKKGAVISKWNIFEDQAGVVDTNSGTLFILDLVTKKSQIIGGGTALKTARLLAVGADDVFVLSNDGIYKYNIASKSADKPVIPKDESWGEIAYMHYYGGNLYLLDRGKSRIWKYVPTDTGFGTIREYLNPDTLPDLTKSSNMSIDGTVWTGSRDGKIWHFSQGVEQTFVVEGVEPSLGQNLNINTNENLENLYITDRENKRLVVLTKDGMYAAQYQWPAEFDPTEVLISKTIKKAIFVKSGQIYAFDL